MLYHPHPFCINLFLCQRFTVHGRIIGHKVKPKGWWIFRTVEHMLEVSLFELGINGLNEARTRFGGFPIVDSYQGALRKNPVHIVSLQGERETDNWPIGQLVGVEFGYTAPFDQYHSVNPPVLIMSVTRLNDTDVFGDRAFI